MNQPTSSGVGDRDSVARSRAVGAGLAMLIVALTYDASRFGESDRWWAAALCVVVGVLLADAVVDIRVVLPRPGWAPLTIVAMLVVVIGCVPETDQLPVVAVVPAALVLFEVVQRRQMPIEWYTVAVATVAWGAMFGATGRHSALAGALFSPWTILLPAFLLAGSVRRSDLCSVLVAGVAAVAAVVMARTGGLADTWAGIGFAVVGCVAVSVLVAWAIARGFGVRSAPTLSG